MEGIDGHHHHITITHPEVGLSVTLFSSMTQVEHHPCVSFFLLARRQDCYVSWFVAKYNFSLCCEEVVPSISCVPLKFLTDELEEFIFILTIFEERLPLDSLGQRYLG